MGAYSGGAATGTPVNNYAGIAGCAGCTSTSTPCPPLPPCVTYGCVTSGTSQCVGSCGVSGVQTVTRSCVAYSGGAATGTPVNNYAGIAGCAGCTSTSTPCPPLPPCVTYGCVTSGTSQCV